MTTAHRPTYKAAVARQDQAHNKMMGRSQQVSKHDMPHSLTTKYRQKGQGRSDEIDRDELKAKLLEKEMAHFKKIGRDDAVNNKEVIKHAQLDDGAISGDEKDDKEFEDMDKDDSDSDNDSSEISGDDDSDDETAELMRELEKIKKERAIETEKKEREQMLKDEKDKSEAILKGNPLLQGVDAPVMGSLKRRWDDDVVFKNQTRGQQELKKRFVNDTIRSDFHKKFLKKYIV